jgi:hypothetical protein
MRLPWDFWIVRFIGKMSMTKLVTQLMVYDLTIFDCCNKIMLCSPKMLADSLSIVSDYSDFHERYSYKEIFKHANE